jgi:hypothetical protein
MGAQIERKPVEIKSLPAGALRDRQCDPLRK